MHAGAALRHPPPQAANVGTPTAPLVRGGRLARAMRSHEERGEGEYVHRGTGAHGEQRLVPRERELLYALQEGRRRTAIGARNGQAEGVRIACRAVAPALVGCRPAPQALEGRPCERRAHRVSCVRNEALGRGESSTVTRPSSTRWKARARTRCRRGPSALWLAGAPCPVPICIRLPRARSGVNVDHTSRQAHVVLQRGLASAVCKCNDAVLARGGHQGRVPSGRWAVHNSAGEHIGAWRGKRRRDQAKRRTEQACRSRTSSTALRSGAPVSRQQAERTWLR